MLQDSWNNVKARTHNVDRVFVLGIGAHEVIVDGTTDYEWEDGRKQVGKWASRMHYAEEGGKLKVTEYQVQFVSLLRFALVLLIHYRVLLMPFSLNRFGVTRYIDAWTNYTIILSQSAQIADLSNIQ